MTMKAAVMQPYFFPYLGYFQLIAAVDCFVAWDDVQYIQRGWVNRNRILLNGEPAYITLALEKAAQTANINERRLADRDATTRKILGQLHAAYRKAPHYAATRAVVEQVLGCSDDNLGTFLFHGLQCVCDYLGMNTRLQLASAMAKDDVGLSGSARVIAICRATGADTYVNAIGGRDLYDAAEFAAMGLDLRFIEMQLVSYQQQQDNFVPYLSIIDVMMFNDVATIRDFLQRYVLLPGAAQG